MPVTYENGEPRVKPGSSKQCQAEKLANEMKKIGQALKQRGIETALTSPKLALEYTSYAPKLHAPKLKLNLAGRNMNGTKKEVPPPPVEAVEEPPKNLVEKLDRFLLPELDSCFRLTDPGPWFGPAAAARDACTPAAAAGPRAQEPGAPGAARDGGEAGSSARGATEERQRRPPHLTLVFPLDLSQFVPPEGMGPSSLGRDDRPARDGEALVDAAASAAAQHKHVPAPLHPPAAAEVREPTAAAAPVPPIPSTSARRKQVQINTEQIAGSQGGE